jgi:protein CpxP
MTRFRWIASTALLVVLATGTCVFAQGPGGRGGRPGQGAGPGAPGRGLGDLGFAGRDLDLSDAQRQQIRAIVSKARTDNQPLAERVRQATEARRKAMATRPVDENLIRSTTQALTAAQTEAAIARAHTQSDVFAILTPEQQAKATQARERREARMAERRTRAEQRREGRNN